jgi:hypothetical protein
MKNTIIVDQSKYAARTNRIPPKKGPVTASFMVGDTLREVSANSYETAINEVKRLYARPIGVRSIILEDVHSM